MSAYEVWDRWRAHGLLHTSMSWKGEQKPAILAEVKFVESACLPACCSADAPAGSVVWSNAKSKKGRMKQLFVCCVAESHKPPRAGVSDRWLEVIRLDTGKTWDATGLLQSLRGKTTNQVYFDESFCFTQHKPTTC
eukprot:TRINITY_DN59697_c0_g2_i1.p1 TRINITY_DN59697_c0_g2~~TRINITY_DN59697_c0_g2_i1.p1  ORF type:complete len:136 (+),score=16.36 TRINITY_DN59697_c0_g2_i1:150-557(+)